MKSGRVLIWLKLTSNATSAVSPQIQSGNALKLSKLQLTSRIWRLTRSSKSSGRYLSLFIWTSRTHRHVMCEMEKGRSQSLLEWTESFWRLSSLNPRDSGSRCSLLKSAISSSSELIKFYCNMLAAKSYNWSKFKRRRIKCLRKKLKIRNRVLPAILNALWQIGEEISRDIDDFEISQPAHGLG